MGQYHFTCNVLTFILQEYIGILAHFNAEWRCVKRCHSKTLQHFHSAFTMPFSRHSVQAAMCSVRIPYISKQLPQRCSHQLFPPGGKGQIWAFSSRNSYHLRSAQQAANYPERNLLSMRVGTQPAISMCFKARSVWIPSELTVHLSLYKQ